MRFWLRPFGSRSRRLPQRSFSPRLLRTVEILEDRTTPTVFLGLESEPNNAPATATVLTGSDVKITGNIFPNADEDYFSFSGNAGDRVYALVTTSNSANASTDSQLRIFSTDGTTLLEFDDDDGTLGSLSSGIAGLTLPATGTFYAKVNHFSATNQLRPYDLYLRVQSGSPTPEVEPNDSPATATPLPASGLVSGTTSSDADDDYYSVTLNAGDTVVLSLDLDPERDNVQWNGRLGLGLIDSQILVVNDTTAGSVANPLSESFTLTVKDAGTYYVFVDSGAPGQSGSYQLSASILPADATPRTTYTNATATPITDVAITTSTITVPATTDRVGHLQVAINLTHTSMFDLDIELTAPDGNIVGLVSDIGAISLPTMNLILDDQAAIPPLFSVVNGVIYRPELAYRLEWFNGQTVQGNWTLTIRDDASGNTGTLNSWSLIVVPEAPLPIGAPTVLFSTDFEANDGGFTHSGTQDEWEWGTPTAVPINTAASGTNAWKTDLDNTYNASSSQDLFSPTIDLTTVPPAANYIFEWMMKYQLENATFDHAFVEVQEVGGPQTRIVWEWTGATMTNAVGNPTVTVQESAGWGRYRANINDFVGKNIRLRFHLDSDTTVQLGGLAIDDVSVTQYGGDVTPPALLSVSGPSAGFYNSPDPLTFTVTYDEAVIVTGTPQIALDIGGVTKYATYTGGSNSAVLTFTYSVANGDNDSNGIASVTPIQLSGGTMKDAVGNDAGLAFTAPDTSGVIVDTTLPTALSIARLTPAGSPTNADSLTFRVTFSEAVTGVDAADFTASGTTAGLSVNAFSTTQYDVTLSGGNLAGLNGLVGLNFAGTVTINDLAGNGTAGLEPAIDETYLVDNLAPTLTALRPIGAGGTVFAVNLLTLSPGSLLPWQISGFQAEFNEAVAGVTAGTLTGPAASGVTVISPLIYNFTLTTPISSGSFVASVGAVLDLAGNSGGTGSATHQVKIGDVNGTGTVTNADLNLIRNAYLFGQPYNPYYDLNGDGVVDREDYNLARSRIGT